MGINNRSYMGDDEGGFRGRAGGLTVGLPPIGKTVKLLLIINVGVFVLKQFTGDRLSWAFGANADAWWQVWRYITFQFLHADFWHIALNMLGLYFLGSPLERTWGSKRFLRFYLSCGAFAGILYVTVQAIVGSGTWKPLIGASGGVYAAILACAVLFPHMKLIFLFFPVPIRLAALIIFGMAVFTVLGEIGSRDYYSGQFWSQVAHLGGVLAGAAWIWGLPRVNASSVRSATRVKLNSGAWQRKMKKAAEDQAEIDRILKKIHDEGINSLSNREKKMLQDATRRQQRRDRDVRRL